MSGVRLDKYLLAQRLVESRNRAQDLIAGGHVTVDGKAVRKASSLVRDGMIVQVDDDANPYVSRAALKLVHGLDTFAVSAKEVVALDLGASTGGFTQVLLERGAARVFAVDVGHGQLRDFLAADPRVVNMEGTNGRDLDAEDLPPLDLVVSDVSFISLKKALPPALAIVRAGGFVVALIKPQFEVGREGVGKGGIVRDAALRQAVRDDIAAFLVAAGWEITGEAESPITGSDGNVEYLIAARKVT